MSDQRCVLVVEPDPSDLSSTVVLLQSAGYRVATASAFEEAKLLLASESPDLLITGVRLGPYNGLHLVLRSRADHPEMAAIVTSSVSDPVLEAEAHRQNAGFLLTPVSNGELLAAITAKLAQSSAAPPASESSEAQL
jgi:DNA-binding NtrC family response regulator